MSAQVSVVRDWGAFIFDCQPIRTEEGAEGGGCLIQTLTSCRTEIISHFQFHFFFQFSVHILRHWLSEVDRSELSEVTCH